MTAHATGRRRLTRLSVLAAIALVAGLITGTSVRNLDPEVFEPQLATNLTYMMQGLVVLLISTDVLVKWLLGRRHKRRKTTTTAVGA